MKNTKQKCAECLELYKKVFACSVDAMAVIDPEGYYLDQNRFHRELFGHSDEALRGLTPAVLFGESPFLEVKKDLYRHGIYRAELSGETASQAVKQIDLSIFPIKDDCGETLCYPMTHHDITGRREAEEALGLPIMAYALEGMMVTDLEGRILLINETFTKITGYSFREVVGKTPALLYSGRQGRSFHKEMWKALIRQGEWQGEIWNRRKDGTIYAESLHFTPYQDKDGQTTHYVGLFSDLSKHEISKERMIYFAHHDVLTGLPNQRLLTDRFAQAIKLAERKGGKLALLYIDLDHFKRLNDELGHTGGDEVLVTIARRLSGCVRDCDTVVRLPHDIFVVLLTESSEIEHAATISRKILHLVAKPILIETRPVVLGASIGVSLFPADGADSMTLLDHAQMAMSRVKNQGRNGYQFYSEELGTKTLERIDLKMAIQRAIDREEFQVYYQPQVDLKTGKISCVEALLRWRHPEKGLLSPSAFIPMAEETRLIVEIDTWVLRAACRQLKIWQDKGFPALRIAVNLSALQFQQQNLCPLVDDILRETGIAPDALELELTESITMHDVDKGVETMKRLHHLGVRIAVDDFGVGYSSLGYLRQFPIHTLKVDQSFVKGLCNNPDDAAITAAIIAMAQNLNLEVVAEGVETEDQMTFLRQHHCGSMQGFYFSRPLPADLLSEFLTTAPRLD